MIRRDKRGRMIFPRTGHFSFVRKSMERLHEFSIPHDDYHQHIYPAARGYRHSGNTAHYMVFVGPAHTPLFDTEPPTMRYLVGKAGALRYTKNRLSESHNLGEKAKQRLLDETRRPAKATDGELVI